MWNKEVEAHFSPSEIMKNLRREGENPSCKLYHSNSTFPLELRRVSKDCYKKSIFREKKKKSLLTAGLKWAHGAEQCCLPLPWGTQPNVSHKIMAAHKRKVAAVIHKSSSQISPLRTPRKGLLSYTYYRNNLLWKLWCNFLCTALFKNLLSSHSSTASLYTQLHLHTTCQEQPYRWNLLSILR